MRYPVDFVEPSNRAAVDRPQQRIQAPENMDASDHAAIGGIAASKAPATSTTIQNEITAHMAQPDDDAKTAALRKQLLEGLVRGKSEPPPLRAGENVERRDGTPVQRTVEPSPNNDAAKAARDTLARANSAELTAYALAWQGSPDVAQQLLGAAQKRIEGERDVPAGARRWHPPLEDRFNVIDGLGSRTYQFRDQPSRVAFTERGFSLTTALDQAAVIEAMVDRVEERGWSGTRVASSEEFKRQAWIEAEARGIKAVGYEPTQGDRAASKQEELRLGKERPARATQQERETGGGTITRQTDHRQGRARALPKKKVAAN